jgi:hypothetical protein
MLYDSHFSLKLCFFESKNLENQVKLSLQIKQNE